MCLELPGQIPVASPAQDIPILLQPQLPATPTNRSLS